MNIIERIFGANWRSTTAGFATSIMGLLAFLAALPYELGGIATVIPPEWKANVAIVGMISAAILHAIKSANGKDKQVVGNDTISEPNRVPTESGGNRMVVAVATLLMPICLMGCASTPPAAQALLPVVTPTVALATTAALKYGLKDSDRRQVANYVNVGALALRSITGTPSPDELAKLVAKWIPTELQTTSPEVVSTVISLITSSYSQYYGQLQGDPKAIGDLLNKIATGLELGSRSFIGKSTTQVSLPKWQVHPKLMTGELVYTL